MGRDKATIDAGGMPLAARPGHALARLCDDVVLAGRAVPGVAGRVVADEHGAEGPLAGLVAGLRAARHPVCVIAACDMPAIHAGVVELLLDTLDGDAAASAAHCARAGGALEPLPAVVRTAAIPALAAALALGARSLRDGLAALPLARLAEVEWALIDPLGATFESWNRPEDVRPL